LSSNKGVEHDYSNAGFWNDKPEAWNDFLPGVKRRMLINTSAATMVLYKMDGGSEVPLHSHAQSQYGVCLEGAGVFKVGEKTWKLKKGDSYYIPPSVTHGLKVDAGAETVLVEAFTPMRKDFVKETLVADGP
jgi:quercetin dioxygenase-like cupin family protein